MMRAAKHLFECVQRARANIAVHDPQRGEGERGEAFIRWFALHDACSFQTEAGGQP